MGEGLSKDGIWPLMRLGTDVGTGIGIGTDIGIGIGLSKDGYIDSIGPIQIPVFPYWIYIGANNTNNLSILLRRSKIVCTRN